VASEAQTALSLYQALTWTSPTQPGPRSIMDLFAAAGFETSWISNQPGMGMFDSVASLLTGRTKNRVFLKHPALVDSNDPNVLKAPERPLNERFRANFDDRVLPELGRVLDGPARDKLIVVHLMGSHSLYRARFPQTDEVFTAFDRPWLTDAQNTMVNDYDNSIRFGDKVIGGVIDAVRQRGGDSFVLAFSDHGQEVYDFRDFAGHTNAVLSPWMVEIPFVAWLSPGYRKDHAAAAAAVFASTGRPYVHRNLPATLADLARIGYADLPETESVVSPKFVARPRLAGGKDYAEFKSSWRPDATHSNGFALLNIPHK
jgi:heptose-I-phosphate ethanolaminephosphotransferase